MGSTESKSTEKPNQNITRYMVTYKCINTNGEADPRSTTEVVRGDLELWHTKKVLDTLTSECIITMCQLIW